MRRGAFKRGIHVGQVCRISIFSLGGTDANEMDVSVREIGKVGGEAQLPSSHMLAE